MVDLLLVVLSELVPLTFALRGFLLRKGFWHGYMQGGLVAAFLLTVAVLLADLAIAIHGLQAQQALRHIYHVLDKHKIFPGILSVRYDTFRAHFEQVSSEESSERSCQRTETQAGRRSVFRAVAGSDSWASSRAAMSGIWQIPSVLGAWTVISALAMQEVIDFPVCISAIMMVITVATMSLKMAWTFPDIAGPFYTVILIFFVSAALGLQVGGAFSLAPKAAVEPLMNSRPGDEPLLPLWRGTVGGPENELNDMPPYAACHITWGSRDAQLSQLDRGNTDMAALALIAYEENCDEMDRLLKAQQCGTRVFALKGTSSWRDVYADIKLFATIEVLQALSKIVPILSLLPVALVQGIVGYTGGGGAKLLRCERREGREGTRTTDVQVLTGHSLGGCIAQIVAARQQLPALVFSSPGVLYSARRFQIVPESARHVVVVVPDGDVIATVDEHAGVVQRIACFKKNGQAASTATCHRLRKTACEVWRACGDAWGRDFSTTCGGYVSPDCGAWGKS
ncbi:Kinase D-interacting substrate of 220 kDa [Durusdinium trenchii]|uniref:Kinase D-interacting substrate of 220 kDa n=1 Tax=Durusdinium trenchii TaxID=1381693 RepID=A0ABP0HSZ8_9DINO